MFLSPHSLISNARKQTNTQKQVYFIGRLANYKYFNMDQAALNAINFYERLYNVELPIINQASTRDDQKEWGWGEEGG